MTAKGFSIDFPVEITGTNDYRKAVATRDQGVADEPYIDKPDAITAPTAGVSRVALEGKTLRFENTDKVWVFNAEGRLVKYANGGISVLSTEGYAPGVYLVRMQSGQVMRTTKLIVK